MPGLPIMFRRLSAVRNCLQGGIERKPIRFVRSRNRPCEYRVNERETAALLTGRSGKTESGRSQEAVNDPQGVQAAGGSRFSHRRSLAACGAGEVDPAWASLHAALVVGAAAAGLLPGDAARPALARPLRSVLPG